ncbi:hypothetical protein OROMI_031776 [Orobanche minor]
MDLFFGSDSSSSDDEIDVVIAIAENMLKDYNSGLIHNYFASVPKIS